MSCASDHSDGEMNLIFRFAADRVELVTPVEIDRPDRRHVVQADSGSGAKERVSVEGVDVEIPGVEKRRELEIAGQRQIELRAEIRVRERADDADRVDVDRVLLEAADRA